METKLEIYSGRDKLYQEELKKLKGDKTSQRNKDLITEFHNYLFTTGSGELRIYKLSYQLRNICRWLKFNLKIDKDLDKLNKKDMTKLIAFTIRLKEYSNSTKADYRRVVKQFFRWFKDEDSRVYSKNDNKRIEARKFYKYLEKDVSNSYEIPQADPLTILTDEDIKLVVEKGCRTPKEKAFISLLHESGARTSEILNLKVGNIQMKDSFAEINLPDGKTGRRTVWSVKSLPYLLKFLDIHPFKDNSNAWLWVGEATNHLNEPMKHRGIQKLINRCFERPSKRDKKGEIIGKPIYLVNKKHNLHWFRHSRATILSTKMPEATLCKYMGWCLGSKQIKIYVHLCVKQLEDVILAVNGIKPKQEEIEQPIKCICGSLNSFNERYCFKCFRPLSVEVAVQDKELVNLEMNKSFKVLMDVAKDPELMKQFMKFKQDMDRKETDIKKLEIKPLRC